MFRFRRWSPRRKALLAAALAILLWAPSGITTSNQPVVTGHSTFYNGESYDVCIASIAGIMKSQVLWFNDQVLVERYGGKGTFVYVTENGSEDPTKKNYLYSEGVFYDFVDPNGAFWHVEEAYFAKTVGVHSSQNVENSDPSGWDLAGGQTDVDPSAEANAGFGKDRTYVWIVEMAERPIHDQFAGDPNGYYFHDLYNFLVLVDTCKFSRSDVTKWDNGRPTGDFNVTHDPDLPGWSDWGHPIGEDERHDHESFLANIWVGKRPTIVSAGANTGTATFHSQWATSPSGQQNAMRAPSGAANQTQERAEGISP